LSNSSKTSTPRTPTKQETSVPVIQNDNSIGPPRDKDDFKKQLEMAEAASKGTDNEQNIKAQLATALKEAAAAKEQLDQATKEKDVELEKLRKEIAEHSRGHSSTTLQKEETKKLKTELERAKKELEALRKQRDAKLAVHERQALANAQAQLILDQEKFAADNEQLRLAREAAQKEINEAARVEAIRKAVDAKEEKLKTFEAVLNADSVALKSEWQRLRERQSALADELEVACGAAVACEAVKHDKAVLLKELRVTLTENLELTEKCAKLEAEMNRLKAKSTMDGHARSVAQETSLSAHSSRTSSSSCLSAPGSAGLPRLPSLNIDHFVPKDQSLDGHRTRASSRDSSTDRKEITQGLVPAEGSPCRDGFNP
jgi:DNA repair exonuclease SbcCD ATPase subunit